MSDVSRERIDPTREEVEAVESAVLAGLRHARMRCEDLPRASSEPESVLGRCIHGIDLDREFCPEGCRV